MRDREGAKHCDKEVACREAERGMGMREDRRGERRYEGGERKERREKRQGRKRKEMSVALCIEKTDPRPE